MTEKVKQLSGRLARLLEVRVMSRLFECKDCKHRQRTTESSLACPLCSTSMRKISETVSIPGAKREKVKDGD